MSQVESIIASSNGNPTCVLASGLSLDHGPARDLLLKWADKISLHGIILKPDGSEAHEAHMQGTLTDARQLGLEMGLRLKKEAGETFFEGWS